MTDGPIRPNAPGGANNPLHIAFSGDSMSFGMVNAALAAADAAVDLNGQDLTGVATVAPTTGVVGTGALAVDAASGSTLTVGGASNALTLGKAGAAASLPGGASIGSAKALTGAGALAVEATGALNLAAAASTTSSNIGRSGNVTTMVGTTRVASDLQVNLGDAGAAATSGTVNKIAGTFTLSSGSSSYTLTNSFIAATSLLFVTCVSGAVAQSVYSFIPGSGSAVLTLSGNAGANAKFAFLVVNAGA